MQIYNILLKEKRIFIFFVLKLKIVLQNEKK